MSMSQFVQHVFNFDLSFPALLLNLMRQVLKRFPCCLAIAIYFLFYTVCITFCINVDLIRLVSQYY